MFLPCLDNMVLKSILARDGLSIKRKGKILNGYKSRLESQLRQFCKVKLGINSLTITS